MSKPLLSIGMIVKNETRCIERCFKSLQPLRDAIPCELVIADTGSADGTRKIAARYADILFDVEWTDDFSAARNAVIDRCSGQWYLTIDADEWLEDIEPVCDFLRKKDWKQFNLITCIQRNYLDGSFKNYSDSYVVRMGWLGGGRLRYRYPIHETLYFTDGTESQAVALPKLVLHHDGYLELTPRRRAEKRRRNMALLRRELEQHPEDLRLLVHCMQSAETMEERRGYVERAMPLAAGGKSPYCSVAYQNALTFCFEMREFQTLLRYYAEWKRIWPHSALLAVDGEAYAAVAEYRLEHNEAAFGHIRNWKTGLKMIKTGSDLHSEDRFYTQYFTTSEKWKGNLQCLEVYCLINLGRYGQVQQVLETLDVLQPLS